MTPDCRPTPPLRQNRVLQIEKEGTKGSDPFVALVKNLENSKNSCIFATKFGNDNEEDGITIDGYHVADGLSGVAGGPLCT